MYIQILLFTFPQSLKDKFHILNKLKMKLRKTNHYRVCIDISYSFKYYILLNYKLSI